MNLNLQDSEPPSPPSKTIASADVAGGLLMTLGMHLLQLPLGGVNMWLPFFFGFTQLFYVLPLIYYLYRQSKRGQMIGVIIAASITLIIGFPIAEVGYECATRNPNAPLW
jgi:hypothetical protein